MDECFRGKNFSTQKKGFLMRQGYMNMEIKDFFISSSLYIR